MAKPNITAITAAAATGGGTTVTISGSSFTVNPLPTVSFGGVNVTASSATTTSITVTAPQHPSGNVDVRVINADDPGNPSDLAQARVIFFQDPTIMSITGAPVFGPMAGGTALQINGSFFSNATAVIFRQEGVPDLTVQLTPPPSPTQGQINVTTLATSQPGTANVLIRNPVTQESAPNQNAQFTYEPPILNRNPTTPPPSALSSSVGPTQGGTSVTITGKNLSQGTVSFGNAPATILSSPAATDTQISVTSPPHSAGAVDVRASINAHASGVCVHDRFFFVPPTIAGVFPNSGPHGTPQNVTITASPPSIFTGVLSVRFGSITFSPPDFTIGPGGANITLQLPAVASAGTVDVILEYSPGIFSPPTPAARYFYS